MNLTHSMLIRWSIDDACYVVFLPEFNCYGGHGATYEAAAASGREAIEALTSDPATLPVPAPFLVGGGQTIKPPTSESDPLDPDWYHKAIVSLDLAEGGRTAAPKKAVG